MNEPTRIWTIHPKPDNDIEIREGNRTICAVWDDSHTNPTGSVVADAELIASAPRLLRERDALLEAAKQALAYIQRNHGTSNHDLSCSGCAACHILKTALALCGVAKAASEPTKQEKLP